MNGTETLVPTFSWYDYTLFTAMILLSILIGLYFGCYGHQDNANEYLLGSQEMSVIPIAISLVASNISGISLLAVPTDIFEYGAMYYLYAFALLPVFFITYYVYLPVFYKLQLVSTYEYLMIRFNRATRLFASGLNTISILLYLPIVIYIPALALSTAMHINLRYVTPVLCAVCIFYTTIGGLKAVVWTDTLQFFVMMGSTIGVLYMGVHAVGGLGEVFTRAHNGNRLKFDFDPDPTKRDTVMATFIGPLFGCLSYMAISQSYIQKYLSMPTLKDSKKALLLFVVGMFAVLTFVTGTGLIMYAQYHDCDPLMARKINKINNILPHYVMDVASSIPGLAGLFISGLFSAALSTMSAVMNSLAGSMYEDFISPHMPANITQKQVSNVLKLLVVIIGVLSTLLVFVIERVGDILPAQFAFAGITNGPLLGLFTLGMLFPMVNSKGALFGGFGGIATMTFIIVGSKLHGVKYAGRPISIEGCNNTIFPANFVPDNTTLIAGGEDAFFLFRITHYYYCPLGTFFTMAFGIIASLLTRTADDPAVNADLISPVVHWLQAKFKTNTDKEWEAIKDSYRGKAEAVTLVLNPEQK